MNSGGFQPSLEKQSEVPLCTDLDGTLIKSDLLHECLSRMLVASPLRLFFSVAKLLQGRAEFKRYLADNVELDVSLLPYNETLLSYLKEEHDHGRKLVLVSASDAQLVERVAQHLNLFGENFGSNGKNNLKGREKARFLVNRYGEKGFDYVGDSRADLPVWSLCREAMVVGDDSLCRTVKNKLGIEPALSWPLKRNNLVSVLKAVRLYQWIKNLLVFVPLVMAHRVLDLSILLSAIKGFLAFGFCASSVYLLNDLFDLDADRSHRIKRYRPIASGSLSLSFAWLLIPLLILGSGCIAVSLPANFVFALLIYLIGTVFYSSFFKRIVVADIVVLAMLYSLRVLAGGFAAGVAVSQWLLVFSMFFFLSLACVKRFSELRQAKLIRDPESHRRGYMVGDLEQISQFGCASGYISVLVLALYASSPEVSGLYSHPAMIWLVCPLILYWVSRIWILTGRGQVHEDPIVFAVKDRMSYLTGLLAALIIFLAL